MQNFGEPPILILPSTVRAGGTTTAPQVLAVQRATAAGTTPPGRASAIFAVAAALMAVGLVAVASASAAIDVPDGSTGPLSTPFGRQAAFVALGLVLMILTGQVGPAALGSDWLVRWGPRVLFVMVAASLGVMLIPGVADPHSESHRWLRFGVGGASLGLQPSELAKPALVLLLGRILAGGGAEPRSLRRGFLPASICVGVLVVLVGTEDFGTAALLVAVGGGMLIAAGCRLGHLAAVSGVAVAVLTILVVVEPYRMERFTAFWHIWENPHTTGYQPIQSLAAVASGGWFGTGLGLGMQKYGYLPAAHTDFIFSLICEEMGVLGGVAVIGLFGLLVWLGASVMLAAPNPFERLWVLGLTAVIGLQAVMNIAVATVVAPTTGISLPLISVGGSGLLTTCVMIGLIIAVARRNTRAVHADRVA